jgi:glycosyltransferase involved in cell wall biosynthesis
MVLMVIDGHPARVERITKIVTSLALVGIEVRVVCPQGSETLPDYQTTYLSSINLPHLRRLGFYLQLLLFLIRTKPSLVHFVNYPDYAILPICLAKYLVRFKVVYDRRSSWSQILSYTNSLWSPIASIVEYFGERLSDGISVVVPAFKERLSEYGEKVVLVPNGVDLDMFRPEEGGERRTTVMCVGGLTESEGPRMFIEAASIVKRKLPEVEFVWVGSGWGNEDQMYKQLSDDLGAEVRFTGWVEHRYVSKHINTSTVCVSPVLPWPSADVAFPVKLFEYWACMKPVVVSNTSGQMQLVTDGLNALVYESHSAKDLAEKVVKLLSNPVLRRKIAKEGRKRAERYSWNNCFNELLALYRRIGLEIPVTET